MSTDGQFKIRLPAALRAKLEDVAEREGKSLTAVIVQRLEDSFPSFWGQVLERRQQEANQILDEMDRAVQECGALESELRRFAGEKGANDPETISLRKRMLIAREHVAFLDDMHKRASREVEEIHNRLRNSIGAG